MIDIAARRTTDQWLPSLIQYTSSANAAALPEAAMSHQLVGVGASITPVLSAPTSPIQAKDWRGAEHMLGSIPGVWRTVSLRCTKLNWRSVTPVMLPSLR